MKAYTNVEQSMKLDKILPKDSYDMYLSRIDDGRTYIPHFGKSVAIDRNLFSYRKGFIIPCWSLATLISLLPKHLIYTPNPGYEGYACLNIETREETFSNNNSVDCCVEMIIKNYEQNKERLQKEQEVG